MIQWDLIPAEKNVFKKVFEDENGEEQVRMSTPFLVRLTIESGVVSVIVPYDMVLEIVEQGGKLIKEYQEQQEVEIKG